MNVKRLTLSSFAVYIFIFAFDWIFHGVFLQDTYAQTPTLWRAKAEMAAYLPFLFAGQLLFSFVFSYIFVQGYENKGIPEGFRYGLWIALILNAVTLTHYAVTPYPVGLVVSWVVGNFLEMGLAGAVLAALYKPKG